MQSCLVTAIALVKIRNKTSACAARNRMEYFTMESFITSAPRLGYSAVSCEHLLMEDLEKKLGFNYYVWQAPGVEAVGALKNKWIERPSSLVYCEAHFLLENASFAYPRRNCFDFTYSHDFDGASLFSETEKEQDFRGFQDAD